MNWKCLFGHHDWKPSINAKWDICSKCFTQRRVI